MHCCALLPTGGGAQTAVTDDDVRALAAEGMQTGALHRHEAEMIDSVLRLADRSIDAIMVPRGDILWLDINEPVATLWDEARRSGHARFLLCRGELEQLIGVISLANLGEALRRGAHRSGRCDVQQPLHVPESISIFKLLETFRRSSVHLGVVTNEYGGIEGLVTPADILKAIAGDLPEMGSRDAAGVAAARRRQLAHRRTPAHPRGRARAGPSRPLARRQLQHHGRIRALAPGAHAGGRREARVARSVASKWSTWTGW